MTTWHSEFTAQLAGRPTPDMKTPTLTVYTAPAGATTVAHVQPRTSKGITDLLWLPLVRTARGQSLQDAACATAVRGNASP